MNTSSLVLRRRSGFGVAAQATALALGTLCPAVLGAQGGTAALAGRILDRYSREPVAHASVTLRGLDRASTSDSAGRFGYTGLPPGHYVVEVRALAYRALSWTVELGEGQVHTEEFELDRLPVVLDSLVVERRPTFAEQRIKAFEVRRASGRGYFITQTQIEQEQPRTLSDLLRNVPGVRMTCRGSGRCTLRMARGPTECSPDYVLDGFPATNSTSVDMSPAGLIGIEVYRTLSETPMQFLRADNTCGTIVIWTRSGLR